VSAADLSDGDDDVRRGPRPGALRPPALEHAGFTFAWTASRGPARWLVRHQVASYSQQSALHQLLSSDFVVPPSIATSRARGC
jgi:hypothetical protein